jgi:putative integral membrane protein (TIGR02587 family)
VTDATSTGARSGSRRSADRKFLIGLARAFGGAIFFALPLLMTMEMWWLGFYMDRVRLSLFIVLMIPMLVGLDHYSGFQQTSTWTEDIVDAMVAYGVGFVASAVVLLLFNIVTAEMPVQEIVGKISLQAIPASFGAVLANSQLGGDNESGNEEERKERAGYGAELFFMIAGAVFLAFNLAPTEEMILIAFKMTAWHAVATIIASLIMMHAFVYAVSFRGQESIPGSTPWWSIFLRYTAVGYAICLLVSAYVLWTFGRYEDHAVSMYLMMAVVLAFPASLGAAAARLIL